MLIGGAILVFCYILLRLFAKHAPLAAKRRGCSLSLPGIAQEVFDNDNWLYNDEWYLNTASAAMAGLISVRIGHISRFLDVKTWVDFSYQERQNDGICS